MLTGGFRKLRVIRIQRLHVFESGPDCVVAFDEDDAIRVWEETIGDTWDQFDDPYTLIPDDKRIIIRDSEDDPYGSLPLFGHRIKDEDNLTVIAPAWSWALYTGRGFLCSDEY